MKRLIFSLFVAVLAVAGFTAMASGKGAKTDVIELEKGQKLPAVPKGKIMVIDFNASWCGPCRMFKPTFDSVAKEYAKKAIFVSVNVDEHPELAKSYGVRSIPTVVVEKKGAEPRINVGLLSREQFVEFLKPSF